MVYIKSWTDFETAATDLYAKAPRKVRYGVKFVPKTGQLVLKMTDDTTCIKYKTFSSIILNRFESLNLRLLSQITHSRARLRQQSQSQSQLEPTTSNDNSGARTTPNTDGEGDDPMSGTGDASAGASAAAAGGKKGGGGKKKKKGKR